MTVRRILTDVRDEDRAFFEAIIAADGGTVTAQPEADGEFTLVADFADRDATPAVVAPNTPQARWFDVALGEVGTLEVDGVGSNPRISAYHATTALGQKPDSVPWCSSFVNFCVEKSGRAGTGSSLARSWLGWGKDAGDWVPGCIVVLTRGQPPKGHVGFFAGRDGDRVLLLGGNQGDAVNISSFEVSRVIGRRIARP